MKKITLKNGKVVLVNINQPIKEISPFQGNAVDDKGNRQWWMSITYFNDSGKPTNVGPFADFNEVEETLVKLGY